MTKDTKSETKALKRGVGTAATEVQVEIMSAVMRDLVELDA